MNIIYIIDFSIVGNSGKNKATREKAKALKNLLYNDYFKFYYPHKSSSLLLRFLNHLWFDIYMSFRLLFFEKRHSIILQRISFLPLTRFSQYLKRMTVISEFHADLKDEIPHLSKSIFEKLILYMLVPFYRINFILSHGIIYNHPSLKLKFDQVFKKPSIFSYNGSNVIDFFPEDKYFCRELFSIDKEDVVFLFLGSISKWHGVDFLIRIFNNELLIEKSNVFLYIVGAEDNTYTQFLKNISINPNIIFLPSVDTLDARRFINASDFCLLSANDVRISPGSPLKLYDYISCGKPVISQSDLLGYSDEIIKYNLGYTVDFTNTDIAVKKIIEILSLDNNNFKYNNRNVAVHYVSWENRMTEWINFCKHIS